MRGLAGAVQKAALAGAAEEDREVVHSVPPELLGMGRISQAAQMEAIRCTIDGSQEAKREILAHYHGTRHERLHPSI
jgi:hypothetical protein